MIFQKPFFGNNKSRSSDRHNGTHLIFFPEKLVLLVLFVEISQNFGRRIFSRHCCRPLLSSHILQSTFTNCYFLRTCLIPFCSLHINVIWSVIFIFTLQITNFLFISFYLTPIVIWRSLTILFFLIFFCHLFYFLVILCF